MPELLLVIGIIALLMAIVLPSLHMAKRVAWRTRCAVQCQQIGLALQNAYNEFDHYPIWDDDGIPDRFTWLDVLVQLRMLAGAKVGYCPEDPRPGELNAARGQHFGVLYPGRRDVYGINYSYGIGVPLSAGAWHSRGAAQRSGPGQPRQFEEHTRYSSQRILAGDANWSTIYNLSGDALSGHAWNYPTQYDNMVAWRHPQFTANVLLQDGHVAEIRYDPQAATAVNTARHFVWYPGEPPNVGPEDVYHGNYYPNVPPVDIVTGMGDGVFPRELVPGYYTYHKLWTVVFLP